MSKNHRNRSWRSAWKTEIVSRTAVHKSGITARVGVSPTNPNNDVVTLEKTNNIDLKRWDLGKITEQAIKLWMDGEF